jgi:hypothetical protein
MSAPYASLRYHSSSSSMRTLYSSFYLLTPWQKHHSSSLYSFSSLSLPAFAHACASFSCRLHAFTCTVQPFINLMQTTEETITIVEKHKYKNNINTQTMWPTSTWCHMDYRQMSISATVFFLRVKEDSINQIGLQVALVQVLETWYQDLRTWTEPPRSLVFLQHDINDIIGCLGSAMNKLDKFFTQKQQVKWF